MTSAETAAPQASPLAWPHNAPRTPAHERRTPPFGTGSGQRAGTFSIADATRELEGELKRLGVTRFLLSTNLRLRQDDLPYSNQRDPVDSGAAVYFQLEGQDTVLPCDRWLKVQDNIYAIARHIEAVRLQERLGVGTVAQAFAGHQQLPPPNNDTIADEPPRQSWSEVFKWPAGEPLTTERLSTEYRRLAKERQHDPIALRELNIARDEAREELERGI